MNYHLCGKGKCRRANGTFDENRCRDKATKIRNSTAQG
jgi:hypothetical protein